MTTKPKQIQETTIVDCKVRGLSTAETARRAGCSISTVERRMAKPDFWPMVQKLRDAALQEASGRLSSAAVSAVDTLEGLLKSESETLKLGTSRAILEHCYRLRELVGIENRLAEIEGKLAGANLERPAAGSSAGRFPR